MEEQARCKKCGRVLKSAASIARGMGSTCAGITAMSGRMFHARSKRSASQAYQGTGTSNTQNAFFVGDLSSKQLSKREVFRRMKAERRRLFEERKPFQCGVLSKTHTPLIYVPAGDGDWKENHSGRIIPHEKLQNYLKRYQFI